MKHAGGVMLPHDAYRQPHMVEVPAAELAALREVVGHAEHVCRLLTDGSLQGADVDGLRAALDKLAAARGEGGGK